MNLGLRVASAAALLVILGTALWVGGPLIDILVAAVVAVGLWEYVGLMRRCGADPPLLLVYPLAGLLLFRFWLPAPGFALEVVLAGVIVAGTLASLPLGAPALLRWSAAVAGALYLGLSFGFHLQLLGWRSASVSHLGLRIVALTLGSAMLGDTVALFAGATVGRHPFFPSISPRKTVEGAVAGMVATTGAWLVIAPLLFNLAVPHALVLGLLCSVAAQGGDLVESKLKRDAGVKDSGALIPGHGGMLDRVDSLVLIGPVVFCYLRALALV